jgi:anti-sigma B factor antagonist
MSSFYLISDETADDEMAVVALAGEVDFDASPDLKARIFGHIKAGRRRLVLDLTDVTFIDSTAVGVLIGAVTRLRDTSGGAIAVVCPERRPALSGVLPGGGPSVVRQVFEVTGLDTGVAICATREEALLELAGTA